MLILGWKSNQLHTAISSSLNTALLVFKGLIKSHQLLKVLFLLQNIFICFLLNLNLIQDSLVFHLIQLSDKRSTISQSIVVKSKSEFLQPQKQCALCTTTRHGKPSSSKKSSYTLKTIFRGTKDDCHILNFTKMHCN